MKLRSTETLGVVWLTDCSDCRGDATFVTVAALLLCRLYLVLSNNPFILFLTFFIYPIKKGRKFKKVEDRYIGSYKKQETNELKF